MVRCSIKQDKKPYCLLNRGRVDSSSLNDLQSIGTSAAIQLVHIGESGRSNATHQGFCAVKRIVAGSTSLLINTSSERMQGRKKTTLSISLFS